MSQQRFLCTAHQDARAMHTSVELRAGGLDVTAVANLGDQGRHLWSSGRSNAGERIPISRSHGGAQDPDSLGALCSPDACDLGDLDSDRCVPDPSDRIYPGSWCQNPGSFRSSSWEDAPSARAGSGVSAWDPAA
ncbi:uncharacterized protein LOC144227628 isoform X1 [Crocuta crocuta]